MSRIDTRPNTISDRQRIALFSLARRCDISTDELRDMAGGSIRALSKAQASALITQLGARLQRPPGSTPRPARRRPKPGVVRMITPEHKSQITRLLMTAFDEDIPRAYRWLEANFKVRRVSDLMYAQRAGEVIHVLNTMIARRRSSCLTAPET